MDKPTTIQRDTLYKEIWEVPATKLAERYGISGSMVARICKDLNVPRPAPGYWSKLKHGYKVKVPKLPPLKDGQKDVWEISQSNVKTQRKSSDATESVTDLEEEPDDEIEYILHGDLKEHQAIKETKIALRSAKPDVYGHVSPMCVLRHLKVSVSEALLDRSYAFLNRFLYLCEHYGLKLECDLVDDAKPVRDVYWGRSYASGALYWKWDEFTLHFRLREFYTVNKIKGSGRYSWDKYEYNPSGKLQFILECHFVNDGPTTFKDAKVGLLEDSVDMIAIQAKKYFELQLEKREEECRQEKLRREREAYEAFMKEYRACWNNQRSKEEGALKSVLKQAAKMDQANQLRGYIQACENRMVELKNRGVQISESDESKLRWLRVRLEMLDPFIAQEKPWKVIPKSVVDGGYDLS